MRPPADTTPEAWKVFLEIQRRMTPGEKIRRVFELRDLARRLMNEELRRRHPEADEREILLRAARQTLGPELCRRAYGDALPEDGPADPGIGQWALEEADRSRFEAPFLSTSMEGDSG
jgi:hypothetical protein